MNGKITCIIIDDERDSIELLKGLVEMTGAAEVVGCFHGPEEFLRYRNSGKFKSPDFYFLDIEMPLMKGNELAETLSPNPVVFVTAHDKEFSAKSYDWKLEGKINFSHLLAKPVQLAKVEKVIQKMAEQLNNSRTHIYFHAKPKDIYVAVDKIAIISTELRGAPIRKEDEKSDLFLLLGNGDCFLLKGQTLKEIEGNLPPKYFFKAHKSTLVSRNFFKDIEKEWGNVEVGEGAKKKIYTVNISEEKISDFRKWLKNPLV